MKKYEKMGRLKSFLITTLIGGLTVLLPGAIIIIVFNWIFAKMTAFIDPIGQIVYKIMGEGDLGQIAARAVAFVFLILLCFATGVLQMTKLGQFLFEIMDRALSKVPGHKMVKEIISQFTGGKKGAFSGVVLVDLWGNDVWCTGFLTDEHEDGKVTVFIPTGPNPTTGGIFHLSSDRIRRVDVPVESAMRSVISCGSGSKTIVKRAFHPRPNKV